MANLIIDDRTVVVSLSAIALLGPSRRSADAVRASPGNRVGSGPAGYPAVVGRARATDRFDPFTTARANVSGRGAADPRELNVAERHHGAPNDIESLEQTLTPFRG
jgi:hypothetical protein